VPLDVVTALFYDHDVMSAVPKQITIRGPSPVLARRLRALSRARGESLNTTVLRVLENALGAKARTERLRRAATWTKDDAARFDDSLRAQRVVDAAIWK